MAWQLKSINRIQLVFCCHFCLASMNSCLFEKKSTNSCTLVGPPGSNTSQQTRIKGPWSIMNMNRFCFRGCHCPPGFGKVKRLFAFSCVAYCLLLEFPPSPLSQVFFSPPFFLKKHLQSFFEKKKSQSPVSPLATKLSTARGGIQFHSFGRRLWTDPIRLKKNMRRMQTSCLNKSSSIVLLSENFPKKIPC